MKFLDVPNSGSIQANTHSHNRAGQYKRNRRSPVQPVGTGRRATVRAAFGAASTAWAGLTNAQRASWESFAPSHPVTDALGQSIVLTGHQMFVRVYASRLNVGLAAPTLPPADLALPDVSDAVMTFSVATGISISFTGAATSAPIAVAVSRPMSAGRGFNKTFWQPPGTAGYTDAASSPFTLSTAAYAAEFGTPVAGQRVFARVTPYSEDGWNGSAAIVSAIVVA